MENSNPFSFSKASDYTDEEINTFWVDIDDDFVRKIIDPTSKSLLSFSEVKERGKLICSAISLMPQPNCVIPIYQD